MATVKAIRIHEFGGPEVLRVDELPFPEPRDDQVVVKVEAASVNPVDYKIRSGSYPAVKQDSLPLVLGRDLSGQIEVCGPNVHNAKKGDPVYAYLGRGGAYAEYVVVQATEAAPKPDRLSYAEAAAVPLAGITAWQGLFDHGGLQAGQRVLIHGGAGGVGHFAVQFAKARGAFVATTVSGEDKDFVRDLGADQVVDYKSERFEDVVQDMDLVFDLVAGETQDRSWPVLREGGILVSTLSKPSEDKAAQHGARGTNYMAKPNAAQLAEIGRLIDEGRVTPSVQATYPLVEASVAHRRLETQHSRGKVVLDIVTG